MTEKHYKALVDKVERAAYIRARINVLTIDRNELLKLKTSKHTDPLAITTPTNVMLRFSSFLSGTDQQHAAIDALVGLIDGQLSKARAAFDAL